MQKIKTHVLQPLLRVQHLILFVLEKKTTDIYIMQLWTQPIFDAETSILSHDGRRLV